MISRIDHVSIAVREQEKAEHFFRDVLGAVAGAGMDDPQARFFWQIFSLGTCPAWRSSRPRERAVSWMVFCKTGRAVSTISPSRHPIWSGP